MAEKPLLLLDVDGPLNPYRAKPERRPEGYTTHRLEGFRVWLNPDHGPLLLAFAAEHGVELAWATTWEHDANRLIGPVVNLPWLPVIEFGYGWENIKGWKFPAVRDYAAGRPLAWLDDDFALHRAAREQFEVERGDTPTLLHTVAAKQGLVQDDLDAVSAWLGSIGTATNAA